MKDFQSVTVWLPAALLLLSWLVVRWWSRRAGGESVSSRAREEVELIGLLARARALDAERERQRGEDVGSGSP
jgi:hypothetical protein